MTVKMKKGNQFADINESSVRQAQLEGWSLVKADDHLDSKKSEEVKEDVIVDDEIASPKRTSRKSSK